MSSHIPWLSLRRSFRKTLRFRQITRLPAGFSIVDAQIHVGRSQLKSLVQERARFLEISDTQLAICNSMECLGQKQSVLHRRALQVPIRLEILSRFVVSLQRVLSRLGSSLSVLPNAARCLAEKRNTE